MQMVNHTLTDASDRLTWFGVPNSFNIGDNKLSTDDIIRLCVDHFDENYIIFLINLLQRIYANEPIDRLDDDGQQIDFLMMCCATRKYIGQWGSITAATLCFVPVSDYYENLLVKRKTTNLMPLYIHATKGIRCQFGRKEFSIDSRVYEGLNESGECMCHEGDSTLLLTLLDKEGINLLVSGMSYKYHKPTLRKMRYMVDDNNYFQALPYELIEEILKQL